MNERMDETTGELTSPMQEILAPESSAVVAITAEINQQVATARRFPRRRDREISDEIMGRATLNEEIASECMYTLSRGAKEITGPSIRFAEIVRASFGNIRVATRFVRIDAEDRDRAAVIVEAAAMDTQTNNAEIIPVRRSIMSSGKNNQKPRMYSADMIAQTVSAAVSIARRNAILAVVPKAVWIEAYQRVIRVLQGDAATLGKRRQDIVTAFGRVGADPAKVFAALGVKSIDDITIEHMPALVGMMTAIKEGESVDAVLGRKPDTETPSHTVVANPLQARGDNGEAGGNGAAADGAASAEAREQSAERDNRSAADDKPKSVDDKPKPQPDKAAVKQVETFPDVDAYEAHAVAFIENAVSRKLLKARWESERPERVRLYGRDQATRLEAITEKFMDKNGSLPKDS